ncbi:MAG: sigma-70 family RNA polymerase sigma factor [Clostridia bacterium]|nr:sigma-70 family RNA polymerase sigma factor [Clostridia bacterium]
MTEKIRKDETINAMIIELFFKRSEKAIKMCQDKYGRLAYSVSYNILHNSEDAEECVSDAMLGLWNSIPPEKPRSLPSYLCSLVRNVSFNRYDYNHAEKRNSEMNLILDELEGVLSSGDWSAELNEGEITEAINDFLAELKERDRVVFVRRYYYSDSARNIAEAMGESEGAIAMRLSRLRAKLRKKLEKEGISI